MLITQPPNLEGRAADSELGLPIYSAAPRFPGHLTPGGDYSSKVKHLTVTRWREERRVHMV